MDVPALARIESLLAELRLALAEAPEALEAEALAAFRSGDKARLDSLMERRARYADLAGRLESAPAASAPAAPPAATPSSVTSSAPAVTVSVVPPAPASMRGAPESGPSAPDRPETPVVPSNPEVFFPGALVQDAPEAPVASPSPSSAPGPTGRPLGKPLPELLKGPPIRKAVVRTTAVRARAEKPKPEGPLEGRSLLATRARFFTEARALLAQPGNGAVKTARLKTLLCLGRALDGVTEDNERRLVNEELASLREAWREKGDSPFFALNPGRYAPSEDWYRLAQAYALVAEAEEARPTIVESPEVATDAVAVLAAIVGFAHATLALVAPGVPDPEIASLRETLTGLGGGLRAIEVQEAIKRRPEEWARYQGLAIGLPALVTKLRADAAKRQRTEDALSTFERLFRDGEADEEFVDRLIAHARDALGAGVRANNPRLRDPMTAYREAMGEMGDPALRPLIDEIRKQERAVLTKQRAEVQIDAHQDDPEHEERLAAVRAYLADRSIGFAGSRKGNDRRVEEFRRALGARELVWPDVEKHHAVGRLVEAVGRCDVVCLLVRFCRHSYKDALDEAKGLGGRMVFLPRGIGLHTVVFELYTQLRLGEPVAA